jgi:hypothetical protein
VKNEKSFQSGEKYKDFFKAVKNTKIFQKG